MRKWKHILSEIDPDKRTAVCAQCGPVKVYKRNDRNRFMCATGTNEVSRRTQGRKRAWIDSFKDVPCADCGVSYPTYIMDFDHVRGVKVENVSDLFTQGASRDVIQVEIDKCDIVCSNCHRERTYRDGQTSREALQFKRATQKD